MEDVLEVYLRPRNSKMPLVCLDEASKQLVAETRKSIAVEPGKPKRVDAEYRRCGTASVFMMNAPLEGERYVRVRQRRTRQDFAEVIQRYQVAGPKGISSPKAIASDTAAFTKPEDSIVVQVFWGIEPSPFIEMVPGRAVDGVVFARPSYLRKKFGYYKAIFCMFNVLTVSPPAKVICSLEVLIGAFIKRCGLAKICEP